ncbi:aldo/keto reductase [Phenylobacterium sp.]|jgi:aryl-alcohol dehydrogenase-like predicted oxidoreductase|uniref:aldo/keto reductase n=1 Tax=Phenylobacterium sp. TaxID=1871053 RepID=UPI002E2F4BA9|nr:aldo/keto reductase [Phenylobacterium sp.]HEX3367142.1 aldo/keto reductase [Phenylobacterium sp.]
MRYRPLGRTGFEVSEIGFGAASWWGKPQFSEASAIRLVHAALDGGVTVFDTGASYSGGHAEARLGRALKGRGDGLVVASKAGTFAKDGRIGRDFSAAAIVASTEASLRKLDLETLPLLQLHGPGVAELTDELRAALADLKGRGLVRALGVNSFDPAVIEHVLGLSDFDTVMVDYNVLRPEREPLIARAVAAGKAVLAGMPLAMGHTGGQVAKLRAPRDLWYAARGLLRHRREVEAGARFGFLGRTPGMTGAQAALSYVLANPDVACAVTGTSRMAHLRDNLAASGLSLPAETLAEIRAAQSRLSLARLSG